VIRLALLLLGHQPMRRQWRLMAGFGLIWIALGLAIVTDAADGITVVATETFGWLLVLEGVIALSFRIGASAQGARLATVKAIALLLFGLLIVDMPWRNDIANSLLFGVALATDGLLRIAAATVIRFARWRTAMVGGFLELGLAGLAVMDWPVSYEMTVPFCIAVALILTGWAIVRVALLIKGLQPGASLAGLSAFALRGGQAAWHGLPPPAPVRQDEPMWVHVWTPMGAATDPRRRPLIDRYIAAVDGNGVISTGHAALEFPPDGYISHYPAADIDRNPGEFARTLRATGENDVAGRFLPSYTEEIAGWCEADAHVRFRRYDRARLAAFWDAYRRTDVYNLTNRNCSVAVALALDVALEGVLDTRGSWLRFAQLMVHPDLWLAMLLRQQAEAMTWTPGLVLDYARALKRIIEPKPRSWGDMLREAIRRYRNFRRRTAFEAKEIPPA
jgi:uncharacterized membrane protein HdeD (DUF308 family)